MVKGCYEFEVHLMVNGEFEKDLQKVRILGKDYEECENKLYDHFKKKKNVKLASVNYVQNFKVID